MPILVILFTGENGSEHSIHKAKEVGPQSTKGVDPRHKGGWLIACKVMVLQLNRVGYGDGHVALCTITSKVPRRGDEMMV